MNDFRFLQDNSLWIIIIALFVLVFLNCNCGCNGLNFDICNLFDGCDNTWMWLVIGAVVVYFLMNNGNYCGFLRNDMQ